MGSGDLARALARDPEGTEVGVADRAMLDYAIQLTRAPATVGAGDVEALRAAGFTDAGILDICQVVAYYNYVNRLADGLGVELEEEWEGSELTLSPEEFRRRRGEGRG